MSVTTIAISMMSLPFLIAVPFLYLVRLRDRRAELEAGRRPHHSENCGGAFGGKRQLAPFVRLSLYDDFLVISFARQWVLRYTDIESVRLVGTCSPRVVRIRHCRQDLPPGLELWSRDGARLIERIEARRRATQSVVPPRSESEAQAAAGTTETLAAVA